MKENHNSLQFRFKKTAHVGVHIRIHHRKYFCSLYATVSSEPKKNPKKIYLDTHDLRPPAPPHGIPKLRRPSAIIGQTVTLDASEDLRKDLQLSNI